MIEKSIL